MALLTSRHGLGLIRHGVIGRVGHIEARLSLPISSSREIAYRHDLAGGCVMVSGYYCLHVMRLLGTDEPTVGDARAKTGPPAWTG